jgi:hypothetical protein
VPKEAANPSNSSQYELGAFLGSNVHNNGCRHSWVRSPCRALNIMRLNIPRAGSQYLSAGLLITEEAVDEADRPILEGHFESESASRTATSVG